MLGTHSDLQVYRMFLSSFNFIIHIIQRYISVKIAAQLPYTLERKCDGVDKEKGSFSSRLRATAPAKSHDSPCVWPCEASMPYCSGIAPAAFSAPAFLPFPRRLPAVCFGLRSPADPFLCNQKQAKAPPQNILLPLGQALELLMQRLHRKCPKGDFLRRCRQPIRHEVFKNISVLLRHRQVIDGEEMCG